MVKNKLPETIRKKTQEKLVTKPTFRQRYITFRNALIVTVLGLGVLIFFVKQSEYFAFDVVISLNVQKLNYPWFHFLMVWTSRLGNMYWGPMFVTFFAILAVLIRKPKESVVIFLSSFGAVALSEIIKFIIARPRPSLELINQIGKFTRPDSFPSGHVLFAIGLYGFLFFLVFTELKKGLLRSVLLLFFGLVIFLMGLSRIYLGAHWFSDVLGALLIGLIWLWFINWFYKKLEPRIKG